MHPLRLLLYASVFIGAVVAWALGAALLNAGAQQSVATTAGVLAFIAFMLPWTGVYLWAIRRASDLDDLVERTRKVQPIERAYHGELDDLARAIEELRMTQVRLRRAFETHRAAMDEIVDALGEGLLAVTPEGRVAFANRRVGEMFGAREVLVGRSVLEVVRKQSVAAALEKALHGQASTDRVTYDERQIEIRAFPVVASPDIAAVALFIDVTRIEQLQLIRQEFLDDFSHEVRTPLAGLKSAAETLEHGGLKPEQEAQLRLVLQRQIGRIERLVRDLSELNQIESGRLELRRREVELYDLVSELGFDSRIEGNAVAYLDPDRAQQIFTNLLDNARKHGGTAITVELANESGEAVARVSDQGPGIPPHELERIFNRFYRVDRSRSQPGTGLGLAIAKHLVAAHGGTIRAYNRPGGGATFEVRFPAAMT
ncbi:MAG TPA: ATP-binding protein [Thermoanaerobaculia bacterium]|nr:ATP-binding protein [Thermoanaerobaculia bacterium]